MTDQQAAPIPEENPSPDTYGRSLLAFLLRNTSSDTTDDANPVTHVRDLPGRDARYASWPEWVLPATKTWLQEQGISDLYTHQAETADTAWSGQHVVVATGTASGKTLGYQLPILTALTTDPLATALYLSPTKALGADQLRSFQELLDGTLTVEQETAASSSPVLPQLQRIYPQQYDGDTSSDNRRWIRDHSRLILTNPDMIHMSMLGQHQRWGRLLRNLRFVVVDECHAYRGVFGSNVAIELRRLLRLAHHYGARPTVILASATTSHPAEAATRLIGMPVAAIVEDGSPQGERTIALWEPPIIPGVEGDNGAPLRRSVTAEASRIMADLVSEGARSLTFVRSRRNAEQTALDTQNLLEEYVLTGDAPEDAVHRVGAYRAGYLPEDRRELERQLNDGTLTAAATTNALELGVDIAGLDAVVIAGFPGTVASFWQQSGRAGRRNQGALVVLIARSDPLDNYLVHHPAALLDKPVEATVTNPANPNLLVPQLWCAVGELPLRDVEVAAWSARDRVDVAGLLGEMQEAGMVRYRSQGGGAWYPAGRYDEAWQQVSLRGGSADDVSIVCVEDSRLLGTADTARACAQLHEGAVYLHQGDSYLVKELDLVNGLAMVSSDTPPWDTYARSDTQVHIDHVVEEFQLGQAANSISVGIADVTVLRQVKAYEKKSHRGEMLGLVELDLPPTLLHTQAVYYTLHPAFCSHWGIDDDQVPGALHAAEHAAIGMLPLLADCDRGDIGGLSTPLHEDTGLPTVFVYDGYQGGAGYAAHGYHKIAEWLEATRDAIESCSCNDGCPSCIQSPKCGNGNNPLDKAGALKLLGAVTALLTAGE